MELLKKGVDYDKLKPQYIIFICTFDPFDRGLHRYTFTNQCHEVEGLSLGDETAKIFLNTRGTATDVSEEMLAFLRFLEMSTAEVAAESGSSFVRALSERVEEVKADEEMGGAFMTFEEKIKDIQWEYEDKIEALNAEREELAAQNAERERQLAVERAENAERERQLAAERAKRLESARRMKADGMSMEIILKYVELTAEEQDTL